MLHQRNVTNLRPLAKLLPDVELYTIEMCGLQITGGTRIATSYAFNSACAHITYTYNMAACDDNGGNDITALRVLQAFGTF